MSGIIERSNAKLEKLGIPNRQVKFAWGKIIFHDMFMYYFYLQR